MAPLRKAASRAGSERWTLDEDTAVQQSGRTNSGLNAEAASTAAALRVASSSRSPLERTLASASASETNLLRKKTQSPSQQPDHPLPPLPGPTPPPHRQISYTPTVSSPLNPEASSQSSSARSSSSDSIQNALAGLSSSEETSQDQTSSLLAAPSGHHRPAPPPPRRTKTRDRQIAELRHQSSEPSLRPQDPVSFAQLGRDYSRYPFMNRSKSSVPATPPPGYIEALAAAGPASQKGTSPNSSSSSTTNIVDQKDPEKMFSPFLDDRITSAPFSDKEKMLLFLDDKEDDDDMHMPMDDDDITFKPRWKDYWSKDGALALGSLIFLVAGLIGIFIILPVLTFTGLAQPIGPDQGNVASGNSSGPDTSAWNYVNSNLYPLMKNIRTGLIDPDTPQSAMTRQSINGETLQLVFSDEFNTNNRSFYPNDDPYWTAPNIWYGATQDLEWYDPDAVSTYDGTLVLQLDKFNNHNLQYRSGMLNSWNQLCFTGGAIEVSISLPGPSGTPGLWPGAWTMGNLGRPGYMASTDGVWPYTYDECDIGITPNQSMTDGTSYLPGQKLAACTCDGQDHPTPGTGRGAPEIDIIEASVDPTNRIGVVTQSFQVAPYDVWYHPNYDFLQIPNVNTTMMNTYCGGPYQQAISGTTLLNNDWYDGLQYQKYAFEYEPGTDGGYISWFVGEDQSYMMDGRSLGPNGNVGSRQVSMEPMSIILNLGFSNSWVWIDWANLTFPTFMRVDYVRLYQPSGNTSVTCDPPGYETTEYIANHPLAYNNPNLTHWDETGYGWPTNKVTSNC